MKSAADHSELCPVLHALSGITGILNQCRSLEDHLNRGNLIMDEVNTSMSPYNLSDSEKQLARFGDRVSIIIGLEVGGKISEREAFEQIRSLYKEIKSNYKNKIKKEHDCETVL